MLKCTERFEKYLLFVVDVLDTFFAGIHAEFKLICSFVINALAV